MNFQPTNLPYRQTGAFNKIVLDYIDQAEELKPFFAYPCTLGGLKRAIEARSKFPTDRVVLVEELNKQYAGVPTSEKTLKNIESLLSPDTFTITTAHQNNLFTGPLYFIYKILHAIKLADQLNELEKGKHFVPVFYIGTEDADLEELNHINLGGEKLVWDTKQTGAVGRMKIDKELVKLIDRMEGQLSVLPFGTEILEKIKKYYKTGHSIQQATFEFVNDLFAEYGLVILLPDNAALKSQMKVIFKDDLLHQTASGIVEATTARLEKAGYRIQAHPREINLFYLKDDKRERILKKNDHYSTLNAQFTSSKDELLAELDTNPERFSPNVILRGLYQETILPNIAFIGGGGETAYWLQYKDLFEHYKVPFPVLVLRNSFMILEKKWREKIIKLGFTIEDIFKEEQELMNQLVRRESNNATQLNGTLDHAGSLYESMKVQAAAIDPTLGKHVEALKTGMLHKLKELEKKMIRAERRKYADQHRQLHTIKQHLFPDKGLQERKENISYYYAKWGRELIAAIYNSSFSLEQEFVVLSEL